MFPEEADLETYESILDATAEYMAATGDEVGAPLRGWRVELRSFGEGRGPGCGLARCVCLRRATALGPNAKNLGPKAVLQVAAPRGRGCVFLSLCHCCWHPYIVLKYALLAPPDHWRAV